MHKMINKNRALRDKYRVINEHLLQKRVEKGKLEWQMDLLKNQRTFNQFLKS